MILNEIVKRSCDDKNDLDFASGSHSQSKSQKVDVSVTEEVRHDSPVTQTNQPCLIEVYRDPATQSDKVIIVISLIGGVNEVEFLLLGPGPGTVYARVTYR